MARILATGLLFEVLTIILGFRLQGVAVKGKLLCHDKVFRNTRVKIYDLDRNPEFRLFGTTREFTDIEPVLYIYHDCDDDIRPCQKRVRIDVPTRYIVTRKEPRDSEWFDIGTLYLENTFPGQDRSCEN
ncbi:unnamed protein product, partial [Mesorhabditis belari]|uniref:Uncharacterized protein n=1 Tax=Mesorhabditis belari TaxID=2138241 RepID=A0AAF3FCU6_9BILA